MSAGSGFLLDGAPRLKDSPDDERRRVTDRHARCPPLDGGLKAISSEELRGGALAVTDTLVVHRLHLLDLQFLLLQLVVCTCVEPVAVRVAREQVALVDRDVAVVLLGDVGLMGDRVAAVDQRALTGRIHHDCVRWSA